MLLILHFTLFILYIFNNKQKYLNDNNIKENINILKIKYKSDISQISFFLLIY